jgi:hypothetical protein
VLALGRRAPRVLARLIGYPPDVRAPVCAEPLAAGEIYFGTGWYGQEQDQVSGAALRRMREHGAVLVATAGERDVIIRARLAPAAGTATAETRLRLRVNDVLDLETRVMYDGFADYEWTVPDATWLSGTNELFFSVSHTEAAGTRTIGMTLASLHVQ